MKCIITFFLALLPFVSFAYDIEIEGIYYNIITKAKQASVTNGDNNYIGDIIIPANIEVGGENYIVTSIGKNAFYSCKELESVIIPEGIHTIGSCAFMYCYQLSKVMLPTSLTTIESGAFYDCEKLSDILLPSGLRTLGSTAFAGCFSLTSINIPKGINSINNNLFSGSGLVEIIIPEGVTVLWSEAFQGCGHLESIEIPNTVTTIGSGAFDNCYSLKSIKLPDNITELQSATFRECSSLSTITLPRNLKSINSGVFYNCSSLQSIIIPEGVNVIESHTFYGCKSLLSITIPSSVNDVRSLSLSGCTDLTDVYSYSTTIPNSKSLGQFDNSYIEYATLHVPASAINDYSSTKPWCDFGSIVPIEDIELPQCAIPSVSYKNGNIEFSCATEGAEFHYSMVDSNNANESISNGIVEISPDLTVSVYAVADGYLKSETVKFKLSLNPGKKGDINNDGEVNIIDEIELVNIILEEKENMQINAGHVFVDLGVIVNGEPVYWASTNLGARNPADFGDYYAWGELIGYSADEYHVFDWDNYRKDFYDNSSSMLKKYCVNESEGYVDNKTVLDLEDDAARHNWGSNWRMPNWEELYALQEQCDKEECQMINSLGELIHGFKFINKNDPDKFIFLPSTGLRENGDTLFSNWDGYYWSSTLNTWDNNGARYLLFYSGSTQWNGKRYFGQSIRPVFR